MPPEVSASAAASQPPTGRMDGHTFISYAREDSDFVGGLVAALSARGIRTWLDTEIAPGADWDRSIDERLRTCANLLIVLSPAAVASEEVRGELRSALNLAKPIVPVLYQPCTIPRQLQTVQYLDFNAVDDIAAARDALAAALLSSTPGADADHRRIRPVSRDLRNRLAFLEDVKSEAAGRLAQSLHGSVLNVRKEKQPEQVTRRWDADVKISHQERLALGSDVRIVEVFDDDAVRGKLLILGAPGSGKTTTMLELGQELIRRAEEDVSAPMPVLCNLSSWRNDGPPLAVWLVDHLKSKYGVRKDCGRTWLRDRLLVPLFDGLDEVEPAHQESCVQAINQFEQDHRPPHLVVCCRLSEYENYQTRLQLNGAIRLLPLVNDQIREYLAHAESSALWSGISGDPETMELARSPLLLRIITVAYEETSFDDWQRLTSASERQAYLFDLYVRRLLSDDAAPRRFSRAQTMHWLAWLANTMKRHGQPELLIEHLQPTWLDRIVQRVVYRGSVVAIGAAVFSLAISLDLWLVGWIPRGAIGREYPQVLAGTPGGWLWQQHDFLFIATAGLAVGVVLATRRRILPIETLSWSWSNGWHGMLTGLRAISLAGVNYLAYVGLGAGLLMGLASLRDVWAADQISRELAGFNLAGYIGAAGAVLSLAVAMLITFRPRSWLTGSADAPARGSMADAVVSALSVGVGVMPNTGPLLAAFAGVSIGLVVRFGGGTNPLSAALFADALLIGLLSGFGGGAISWWGQSVRSGFIDSVSVWMLGGIGVAATSALMVGFVRRLKRPNPAAGHPVVGRARRYTEALVISLAIVVVSWLIVSVARRTGEMAIVRGIVLTSGRLGGGWTTALSFALWVATVAGLFGMITGAFLGALFGVLAGLTGPDVERRTTPNQGIRESAGNVGVCALVGLLIVGVPYGLMNVIAGAVWTRVMPSGLDWVNFGLAPALWFGSMGGLVPGAACIQHLALRFVLWCFGLAPWQYARFLNYATERMLLQRVGGRYRFIHDLLREHFAAMPVGSASAPPKPKRT